MSTTQTTPKAEKIFRVLIRVDQQLDFMPEEKEIGWAGGSLAVKNGNETVAPTNALSRSGVYDLEVETQDEHEDDSGSFAATHGVAEYSDGVLNGVPQKFWPKHCVNKTKGWEFHPGLDRSRVARTFPKGKDSRVDSYSGLYDNGRRASAEVKAQYPFLGQSTGLAEFVNEEARKAGATKIVADVLGLAPPYCPSFTALDALDQDLDGVKWEVNLIEDAVRSIEFAEGDHEKAMQVLRDAGVGIIHSSDRLPKVVAQ